MTKIAAMPIYGKKTLKIFFSRRPWVDINLFHGKGKHRKILEHKVSWKIFKIFPHKCSNDDLGLALTLL